LPLFPYTTLFRSYNFNDKNHLSWYFHQTHTVSPNANGFTQPFTEAIAQDEMNYTMRLNYDRTISPTTLLHVGVGYFQYNWPQVLQDFDQSKLGWPKNYYVNMFPNIPATGGA